jgi:thiamine biosynthesis protein ThiS
LRVHVNGEIRELPDELTLDALVRQLALAPERLAIELNREVVRRARWSETVMRDGDKIEIVHFVGGGSDSSTLAADEN